MAKSDSPDPLPGTSGPHRAAEPGPGTEPFRTASPAPEAHALPRAPADRLRSEAAARQTATTVDDDEEQVRWSGGYSPRAMLGTWIAMVLLSVAIIVGAVLAADRVPWWVAPAVLLVLWMIVAGLYAVRRMGMHYELTTQRFLHQSGILSRRTDRIEVIDINDVSFVQGPVQRLTGVGTIRISSSDRSHPELSMPGIADVREVAGLIDDIRRKERRRRSLHIESI